ncbi:MAG: ATP-dependent Clp protease adapter ClpS [Hyphomonas sp.]|nr:ATP-dependent Clp protease adapter ClpS [Hyphomonas sp.]
MSGDLKHTSMDPARLNKPGSGDPPGGGSVGDDDGTNFGLSTQTRVRTKKPSLYRVLLLNDDYTPMEFVVYVLEQFFNRSREQATRIMLHVHQKGVGLCGVYTYEVAETKVAQVLDLAKRHEHPLQCVMEKDD